MMQYDRITLGRQAKELGFVRDTLEKVCRLADVLAFMEKDPFLSDSLALKGGTAINLTIFDLPRLSVDIDLDYAKEVERAVMLNERKKITEHIQKYMVAACYQLSAKSKQYHALDSFVYDYVSAGGMKDNLKIEINYMLRAHILPVSRRRVNLPWQKEPITVLSVDPLEIFGAKIVALLSRTAARDLYDIFNLQKYGLFDESEEPLLRKCVVFYSAIAAEKAPECFAFDRIMQLAPQRIKTDLIPVLRRGEHFYLEPAQKRVMEYLKSFLLPENSSEIEFWQSFNNQEYRPDRLFPDGEFLDRIKRHPMALWKCGSREKTVQRIEIT